MADNLTPDQRRKAMTAVKGTNTSLELKVDSAFRERGWVFERNVESLTGRPDFVFLQSRVIVFVDGDFWHGWRFPIWKDKLTGYWKSKIERTRRRDRLNFQRLRRQGWRVLRFWEHQIERDLDAVVKAVAVLIDAKTYRATKSNETWNPSSSRLRRRDRSAAKNAFGKR